MPKKVQRSGKSSTASRRRSGKRRRTRGIDAKAKGIVQAGEPARDNEWAHLESSFSTRLYAALSDLERRGTPFKMVEGFRTVERQQWLYGSGRPQAKPYGRPGPVVTHRDGVKALSNHQGSGDPGTGRGADCYPMRNGKVYIPSASDSVWDEYAEALQRQGLVVGHRWPKFKDSPHAELPTVAPSEAARFVRSVRVPSAARRPAGVRKRRGLTEDMPVPMAPPVLEDKAAQALVAGSGLVMSEEGVSLQMKEDIINCTLFAQFAASATVKDRADVVAWYQEYFDALRKLGWDMTSQDFREYKQTGKTVEVHKAIMTVLTAALGPAAATLAVAKSVLDGLEDVGSDNGWLKLFDRESVSAKVARFQVVTAQPVPGGLVNIGLLAFSLEAKKKFTQVLFFKFKKSDASLRSAGGTASISESLLKTVRKALRKKLEQVAADFVASIDIPAVGD